MDNHTPNQAGQGKNANRERNAQTFVAEQADKAKQGAQQAAEDLKRQAQQRGEQNKPVVEQAKQAGEQAKQQIKEKSVEAQEQVKSMLQTRKEQAIGEMGSIAQALREVSRQMREQDRAPVARYTDQMAGQIDRATRYLSEREVDQVVQDIEHLARRQPEVVLGGALLIGLAVGRFLRSSASQPQSSFAYDRAYGSPSYYSQGPGPLHQEGFPPFDEAARHNMREQGPNPSTHIGGM